MLSSYARFPALVAFIVTLCTLGAPLHSLVYGDRLKSFVIEATSPAYDGPNLTDPDFTNCDGIGDRFLEFEDFDVPNPKVDPKTGENIGVTVHADEQSTQSTSPKRQEQVSTVRGLQLPSHYPHMT